MQDRYDLIKQQVAEFGEFSATSKSIHERIEWIEDLIHRQYTTRARANDWDTNYLKGRLLSDICETLYELESVTPEDVDALKWLNDRVIEWPGARAWRIYEMERVEAVMEQWLTNHFTGPEKEQEWRKIYTDVLGRGQKEVQARYVSLKMHQLEHRINPIDWRCCPADDVPAPIGTPVQEDKLVALGMAVDACF